MPVLRGTGMMKVLGGAVPFKVSDVAGLVADWDLTNSTLNVEEDQGGAVPGTAGEVW